MPPKVRDIDRGYKKLLRALKLSGRAVRVGIQGGEASAVEHDNALPNVTLGLIHEYGAPDASIPQRSFLRSTYDERLAENADRLRRGALAIYAGRFTAEQVLGIAGEKLRSDIINKINAGIDPPLQPATVEAKGSSKPLVDTGQLKNSITWRLESGKAQPGEKDVIG